MLSGDYRTLLKSEYERRKALNKSYSMKMFAADLGIQAPQLSRVLSGQRNFSILTGKKVAQILYKSKSERDFFVNSVIREITGEEGSLEYDAPATPPAEEAAVLDAKTLELLGRWYFLSMMDLMAFDDPPRTPADFAQRLGIDRKEAAEALEKLSALGLIRPSERGYTKTHRKLMSSNGIPSPVIRQLHKQFIEKSLHALANHPVSDRYFMGRTVSVSHTQYEDIKAATDKYLSEVSKIVATKAGPVDTLLQVNVQVFNLLNM